MHVTTHRLTALLLLAQLLLLASCRSLGEELPSERIGDLRLGETSEDELRVWFGAPARVASHATAELRSRILYYRHAVGTPKGGKGRVLAVEIADERVRAFLFDSSFESDSTDFDGEPAKRLIVFDSTREDARAALGAPSGRALLPSHLAPQHLAEPLPEAAAELWFWRHTKIRRRLLFLASETRLLALAFGADGTLLQVQRRDARD